MQQQTANMALQFMQRVNLQGGEVAAWQQVVDVLLEYANPQGDVVPINSGAQGETPEMKGPAAP